MGVKAPESERHRVFCCSRVRFKLHSFITCEYSPASARPQVLNPARNSKEHVSMVPKIAVHPADGAAAPPTPPPRMPPSRTVSKIIKDIRLAEQYQLSRKYPLW